MDIAKEFDSYMAHLMQGLGHVDRHTGLTGYCTGLMLPLSRKSVEPIAARVNPLHASAKHQSLHHFVAKAQWVVPLMNFTAGGWWIIDDTGFPKKGKHSVGVMRQYCGVLGKQDNCQVAVSVTLACEEGSLPVAWRLYLPHVWAEDAARRTKAGIPQDIEFGTKPQIALQQIQDLLSEGAPRHCVLAEPEKYYLSTLPEDTALNDLVHAAHMRWRIERDYQDLKQDLGLGHYEGRGWRGFYHHATLSIAAYGLLMAQRLKTGSNVGGKKTSYHAKHLPFPTITSLGAVQRAQRHVSNSITTLRIQLSVALAIALGHCPHCSSVNLRLRL